MEPRTLSLSIFLPSGEEGLRCLQRVQDSLRQIRGVEDVSVNNGRDTLRLRFRPDLVAFARLEHAVRVNGADFASQIAHTTLVLDGIHSPEFAATLADRLAELPGVLWSGVSPAGVLAHLSYETALLDDQILLKFFRKYGIAARVFSGNEEGLSEGMPPEPGGSRSPSARVWTAGIGLALALFAIGVGPFLPDPRAGSGIVLAALIIGSLAPIRDAFFALNMRCFDRSLSVLLCTGLLAELAFLRPEEQIVRLGTAAAIPALFTLAGSVQNSLLAPLRSRLLRQMARESSAESGDWQDAEKARTLAKIAAQAFTGDYPALEELRRRDRVLTLFGAGTALILLLIPIVQQRGVSLALLREFAPRSLGILLLTAAVSFGQAAVLPLIQTLLLAAEKGIRVQNGQFLTLFAAAKVVLYEKFGALSAEPPTLEDVIPLTGLTCVEAVQKAAALASRSRHPLAEAISLDADGRPEAMLEVRDFQEIAGKGLYAVVNGESTVLGSVRLFQDSRLPLSRSLQERITEIEAAGKTVVLLGGKDGIEALFCLAHTIRADSREVSLALDSLGIDRQAILTGGNKRIAAEFARKAGLAEVVGSLLPDEKITQVTKLHEQFGPVAVVGDIGKQPAFHQAADVSLGFNGNMYPERLASDLVFLHDDFTELPALVRLCRRTVRAIRNNVALTAVFLIGGAIALLFLRLPLPLLFLLGPVLEKLTLVRTQTLLDTAFPAANTGQNGSHEPQTLSETEAILELVFVHDSAVDEDPSSARTYPDWASFVIAFSGEPLRFGRRSPSSSLPIQIKDEGLSRAHGEIRLEGNVPVLIDTDSTNGIRLNGHSVSALIPAGKPVPIKPGDTLRMGRNTRIEIRWPSE